MQVDVPRFNEHALSVIGDDQKDDGRRDEGRRTGDLAAARALGLNFNVQIARDRAALARAFGGAFADPGPRQWREIGERLESASTGRLFGPIGRTHPRAVIVEPMFPDAERLRLADPFAMHRHFVLRIVGYAEEDLRGIGVHVFDLAYTIEDMLNDILGARVIERVVPDRSLR